MPRTDTSAPDTAFRRELNLTAGQLLAAVRTVVGAVVPPPCRPVDVERALALGKDVSHRLMRCLNSVDDLEAIHRLPAPESLRRLLRAAERKGVGRHTLRQARQALDTFERLILVHTGDRGSLDVILGGWVPSVRDRVESQARQWAFRGMSHLKGCFADLRLVVAFVNPSAADPDVPPGFVDGVIVDAYRGVCRLRPGAEVRMCSITEMASKRISGPLTLDGTPARAVQDVVVPSWTSVELAALRFINMDRFSAVELADDRIGLSMAAHVATAIRHNRCLSMAAEPGASPAAAPDVSDLIVPCRQLVFDVYLHEDAFPGEAPTLVIRDPAADRARPPFEPGTGGEAKFDTADAFAPLDRWRARLADAPSYDELIGHVFAETGWQAERFRAYRATIDFPVYGSIVIARLARRAIG